MLQVQLMYCALHVCVYCHVSHTPRPILLPIERRLENGKWRPSSEWQSCATSQRLRHRVSSGAFLTRTNTTTRDIILHLGMYSTPLIPITIGSLSDRSSQYLVMKDQQHLPSYCGSTWPPEATRAPVPLCGEIRGFTMNDFKLHEHSRAQVKCLRYLTQALTHKGFS